MRTLGIALLLVQVTGVLSAAGDVGEACITPSNTCTNSNAFCKANVCTCKANFVQKGTGCARVVDQPCGAGQCLKGGNCTLAGTCGCGAGLTATGTTVCSCPAGKAFQNGACVGTLGQTCTTATECVNAAGVICGTRGDAKKCTCNTNANFDAGSDGATSCGCASGYRLKGDGTCGKLILRCTGDSDCMANAVCTANNCVCNAAKGFTLSGSTCICDSANKYATKSDGSCGKVIGQTCTIDTDCVDGTGIKCGDVSGTKKCICDITKNVVADTTSGGTSCNCAANYALMADKSKCGKVIGQTCSADTDCVDGTAIKCGDVSGTNKCICDTAKNFVADTSSAGTSCNCAANYALMADKSECGKVIGQTCSADTDCVDGTGIKCGDVSGTKKCICDTAKNFVADTSSAGTSCTCAANYKPKSNGDCGKVIGQTCSTVADCVDGSGITCADAGGSNKCICDITKDFAADTSSGGTSCTCKTDYASKSPATSGCGQKVAGASCNAGSNCVDLALCTNNVCVCDTAKHFTANSNGLCVCDNANNFVLKSDATCGKTVGQSCNIPADCLDHAVCNSNKQCACDTASGYTGSTISCTCDSTKKLQNKWDGTCGKYTGENCTSSADCIDNAVCDLATSTCVCDAANGFAGTGGTCLCATGYVAKGDGSCGKEIGGSCAVDACAEYATCGTSGKCACQSGYTVDANRVCQRSAGVIISTSSLLLAAGFFLVLLRL